MYMIIAIGKPVAAESVPSKAGGIVSVIHCFVEVLVVLQIILISDENLSHASHGCIGPAWGPVQ